MGPTLTQDDVVAFLSDPVTHGGPVERIDTHSAVVFLTGRRALKMKRAVAYSYLDFSTLERRKDACDAEVALNRRTAPDLYLGTLPVTRAGDGTLRLGGGGTPLEWVVDMVRFGDDALLDRMAMAGRLDLELMPRLSAAIARFHADAAVEGGHGGYLGILRVIQGNAEGFARYGAGILPATECAQLTGDAQAAAATVRTVLDHRRDNGLVRRCHGDLHLRNLVLWHGEPTLFDAVEFNDEIACIDLWYDVAFLLMDLIKRGLSAHANVVLNTYLAATDDVDGLLLLPIFLSCRSGVRAMTNATSACLQTDADRAAEHAAQAREYLRLGHELLTPPQPRVVAVGGLSGSGKSTMARHLAPQLPRGPGAVLLRSDDVRKRLCGRAPLERLGPEAYTPAVTRRVYQTLFDRAAAVVARGWPVILDAVFAQPEHRAGAEAVAASAGCPFAGLWLDAPAEVLKARVRARRSDASDADQQVVDQQLEHDVGALDWARLDSTRPADELMLDVRSHLARRPLRAPART